MKVCVLKCVVQKIKLRCVCVCWDRNNTALSALPHCSAALRGSGSQSEKSEQNSADIEHFLIYPASLGLNGFLVSEYKLNFLV